MKNSAPLVSLTLAAFNVAVYLDECLSSILIQSYQNFELIVVDDASSDSTREILLRYAKADGRIRLILKDQNEGLSMARNDAIAAARGEYVAFLDGDDVYSPEMVKSAVDTARNAGAEVVMWDYLPFWDPREIPRKLSKPSALEKLDPSDPRAALLRPAFACTKLVRRDLLVRLNIQFPPGLTYQDVPVHWALLTKASVVAFIPKRFLYYRQQPHATTAGKGMRRADYFIALDLVESGLRQAGDYAIYQDMFVMTQLNAWHGVYDVISEEHRTKVLSMIDQRFTSYHHAYVLSSKPLRWRARTFYKAIQGSRSSRLALSLWAGLRSIRRAIRR